MKIDIPYGQERVEVHIDDENFGGLIYPNDVRVKDEAQTLMKALENPRVGVRGYAAWTLGEIGPKARAAIPALVKALGDSDADVRRLAAGALGEIGPEDTETLSALEKVLKDADPDVRNAAAMTLKKIRGSEKAGAQE